MPKITLRRPRAVLVVVSTLVGGGLLAFGGVVIVAGPGILSPVFLDGGRTDTVGEVGFDRALAIPPLAESRVDDSGVRVFDLTARAATTEFRSGIQTPTWGFDGSYLGPTLRATAGETVRVDIRNELSEATNVHWHGMRLPARMDGGPHRLIDPGDEFSPEWTIDQPASTLWYHPHPHGATEQHVAKGLAGMFLVDDDESRALGLPSEYGVDDIPLIVQDTSFAADGSFDRENAGYVGPLGDTVLVNGTVAPYLGVTTSAVRLRVLNASSARVYDFSLESGDPIQLIGTDGGLLAAPHVTDSIRLSPGERGEIVVRMEAGSVDTLVSLTPELGMDGTGSDWNGGADRLDVIELRAASVLRASSETPSTLATIDRIDPGSGAVEREFQLSGFGINDASMDPARIDEVVELGSTEVWTVENQMGLPHTFHVHGIQFQVLSVGGAPPGPELSGWKDTVYLPPEVPHRLVMRFEDYSDPDNPYMFHCHLLTHEDRGMMGQFVVVRPGQEAGTPPPMDDRDTVMEGMPTHEH